MLTHFADELGMLIFSRVKATVTMKPQNSVHFNDRGFAIFGSLLFLGLGGMVVQEYLCMEGFTCHQNYASPYGVANASLTRINQIQQENFQAKKEFLDTLEPEQVERLTKIPHFNVSIRKTPEAAFSYAVPKTEFAYRTKRFFMFTWQVKLEQLKLKSYVGGVFVPPAASPASATRLTTLSIICETETPAMIQPAEPFYEKGKLVCGRGTQPIRLGY